MLFKTVGAKASAEGDEGEFEALVSVFGNVDSVGDVVMPGAFKDDLAAWAAKGDAVPVIWSHDWSDPFSHLGRVLEAEERKDGLWIHGRIEDMDSNPKAAQVYRLLKGRRVTQFSFAYDVLDGGWADRDDREVYELRKLHLFEAGPTLVGANQETELFAVKAADLAAGFTAGRSARPEDLEHLEKAYQAIGAALAAAKATDGPVGAPEVADIKSWIAELDPTPPITAREVLAWRDTVLEGLHTR